MCFKYVVRFYEAAELNREIKLHVLTGKLPINTVPYSPAILQKKESLEKF